MRVDSLFVWGLAFAVVMLMAIVTIVVVMACVLAWRDVSKKYRKVNVGEDLQKKIDEARRGGSQVDDFK
jgi:hypothetical protein